MKFYKVDKTPVLLKTHIEEFLKKHPKSDIHIGCDSQKNRGSSITYATVVAFRYSNKGVHYIYTRDKFKFKIRISLFERLWKEVERTIETAVYVRTHFPNNRIIIDYDFSPHKKYESNKLVSAATGWAKGLGFEVNIKPESVIAARASNEECRKK